MASRRVLYILLLLVVLAPLPLGGNRMWAWTLYAVVIAALAVAWASAVVLRRAYPAFRLPLVPAGLFLVTCAWAFMQSVPWMPEAWAHPLWDMASEALNRPLTGRISVAPGDSLIALTRLLTYGLAFLLAFHCCQDAANARMAFAWLTVGGLIYAVFALVVFWTGYATPPWFQDPGYSRDARGPFVNRNHFATWLALCLMCALALYHQRAAVRRNPAYQLRRGRGMRLEQFLLEVWKPLLAVMLMVTALILTHSRAGFASAVAGGAVLLVSLNYRQRIVHRRSKWMLGALVGMSLMAFWLSSEVLMDRMQRLEASFGTRLEAYGLVIEGIEDNPLLGYGYGTFSDSFRLYRDERLGTHFDKAHNTYLETIFELGWPAACALFAAILGPVLMCLRGLLKRRRHWIYPTTALAATVVVAVHSMFDFSVQIPAVALAWTCILGIGTAQSLPRAEGRRHDSRA